MEKLNNKSPDWIKGSSFHRNCCSVIALHLFFATTYTAGYYKSNGRKASREKHAKTEDDVTQSSQSTNKPTRTWRLTSCCFTELRSLFFMSANVHVFGQRRVAELRYLVIRAIRPFYHLLPLHLCYMVLL